MFFFRYILQFEEALKVVGSELKLFEGEVLRVELQIWVLSFLFFFVFCSQKELWKKKQKDKKKRRKLRKWKWKDGERLREELDKSGDTRIFFGLMDFWWNIFFDDCSRVFVKRLVGRSIAGEILEDIQWQMDGFLFWFWVCVRKQWKGNKKKRWSDLMFFFFCLWTFRFFFSIFYLSFAF